MSYPDALEAVDHLPSGAVTSMYSLHWKPHGLTILGRWSYLRKLSVRSRATPPRHLCQYDATPRQGREQQMKARTLWLLVLCALVLGMTRPWHSRTSSISAAAIAARESSRSPYQGMT